MQPRARRGNGASNAKLSKKENLLLTKQHTRFQKIRNDPTSDFGRLLANLVLSKPEKVAEGMADLVNYLKDESDKILDEVEIVEATIWGYQFSKMTMYYLVRYVNAVIEFGALNPIRARVMGLVASISFYLQACAELCYKELKTDDFAPAKSKPSQSISRMKEASLGIETAIKENYKLDLQGTTWERINNFLTQSVVGFSTQEEENSKVAFSNLQKAYDKLGNLCATEANKLFSKAVNLKIKEGHYAPDKFATGRRKNLNQGSVRHVICKNRYKLLGRYVYLYSKMTRNDETENKIDLENITFGDDEDLSIAFDLLDRYEEDLQFWENLKLDLVLTKANKAMGKIEELSDQVPLVEDLIKEYAQSNTNIV